MIEDLGLYGAIIKLTDVGRKFLLETYEFTEYNENDTYIVLEDKFDGSVLTSKYDTDFILTKNMYTVYMHIPSR